MKQYSHFEYLQLNNVAFTEYLKIITKQNFTMCLAAFQKLERVIAISMLFLYCTGPVLREYMYF